MHFKRVMPSSPVNFKRGEPAENYGSLQKQSKTVCNSEKKKLYSPLIKTFFLASYDLFKFIVHDYGSHKTMFYCIAICGTWLSSYYRHFGYGISSKVGPN